MVSSDCFCLSTSLTLPFSQNSKKRISNRRLARETHHSCSTAISQLQRNASRDRPIPEGECCASVSIQGDKHKHIRHKQFKLQLCIRTLPEGECCASVSTQGDKHKHIRHKQFKCLPLHEQRLYSNTAGRNTMAATQMHAHHPECIPSNAMRHNTIAFH
jgi:hypothetical protein